MYTTLSISGSLLFVPPHYLTLLSHSEGKGITVYDVIQYIAFGLL